MYTLSEYYKCISSEYIAIQNKLCNIILLKLLSSAIFSAPIDKNTASGFGYQKCKHASCKSMAYKSQCENVNKI